MKKNCKKQIKKTLEQKNYLRKKGINNVLNGKDMIIHLIIKKMLYKNESMFS